MNSISIQIRETRQNIIDVLNKSNIHPEILSMIIGDIYKEILSLAEHQYFKEKKEMSNKIEESTNEIIHEHE